MRRFAVSVLLFFGTSLTAAIGAGAPDALFRGTVGPFLTQTGTGWCATEIGPTLFQRSNSSRALISFPALRYTVFAASSSDAPSYFTLSGNARLVFGTAHGGRIEFDEPSSYPTDVTRPRFSQYSEHYNAALGRLVVSFKIAFGGCTLDVSNTYWN